MQASYYPIPESCASSVASSNYPSSSKTSQGKRPSFGKALARSLGSVALAAALLAPVFGTQAHTGKVAQALPSAGAPMRSVVVASTGKRIQGDFLATYERFGVERIGYPVSDQVQENGMTVQYFERVRMEYHPELMSQGRTVLMSRLGADFTQNTPFSRVKPFKSTRTQAYVKETGHSLSEPFLSYWKRNGSVELFGYPISEPMAQDGMTVQWFERTRFEYHPELERTGNSVQLSHLGKAALERRGGQPATAAPQTPAQQAPKAPAEVNLSGMERYMLDAINGQRAAAGLAPVQVVGNVTDLSRARSTDMAQRNYFSHTTPEGVKFLQMLQDRGIPYKYAGEILARNNYPDAEAAKVALDSYLNSAPHKAIMLDGRYNTVGVGYAKSADGMHYWTVILVEQ
ncbi:MAG TPA: CAP domain-containing protein [Chloroflexia bacterium]|nr:CAP domain-containing protein [Chloroflexia bacterium]